MHAKRTVWMAMIGTTLVAGLAGCETLTRLLTVDVDLPAAARVVADNPVDFTPRAEEPLLATRPGTVVDPLSELDGCWGSVWIEDGAPGSLYTIFELNAAEGTAAVTSFPGVAGGGPFALVSRQTGRFEASGPATVVFTWEQFFSNVGEHGEIRRRLQPEDAGGEPVQQAALFTLDGARAAVWLGVASVDEIAEEDVQLVFYAFDCP